MIAPTHTRWPIIRPPTWSYSVPCTWAQYSGRCTGPHPVPSPAPRPWFKNRGGSCTRSCTLIPPDLWTTSSRHCFSKCGLTLTQPVCWHSTHSSLDANELNLFCSIKPVMSPWGCVCACERERGCWAAAAEGSDRRRRLQSSTGCFSELST